MFRPPPPIPHLATSSPHRSILASTRTATTLPQGAAPTRCSSVLLPRLAQPSRCYARAQAVQTTSLAQVPSIAARLLRSKLRSTPHAVPSIFPLRCLPQIFRSRTHGWSPTWRSAAGLRVLPLDAGGFCLEARRCLRARPQGGPPQGRIPPLWPQECSLRRRPPASRKAPSRPLRAARDSTRSR